MINSTCVYRVVLEYTNMLYQELYKGYDELRGADTMLKDMILTYSEEAELRGIEKGIEKNTFEIARKMLDRGMALADIVEIVGLPLEKVQTLAQG